MSGYIAVISADMDALHSEITASINALMSAAAKEAESVNALIDTGNMSGNTAVRMKNYMSVVHGKIINDIMLCCQTLYELWECYRQEYRSQVDNAGVVYISSGELAHIRGLYNSFVSPTDSCLTTISSAISSVSDITSAASLGANRWFQEIFNAYKNCDDYIDDLNDRIEAIESKYKGHASLSTIRDKISDLLQMVNEYYGKQNMHWTSFDASSAMQSPLYQKLERSSEDLGKTLIAIDGAAKEAIAAEEAHFTKAEQQIQLDELLETEKRRQQVAWKKGFASVVTLAVDVVVIVGTAGMGTPAVIAANTIAGGLTLGLSNATDSAVDQYIDKGEVDYKDVIIEGTKGLIVGSTSSAISSGVSEWCKGVKQAESISAVLKPATKTTGKLIKKEALSLSIDVASGVTTKWATGVTKRGLETMVDGIAEGKGFVETVKETASSAFDPEKIRKDTELGVTAGLIDFAAGTFKSGKGYDKLGEKGKESSHGAIFQNTMVAGAKGTTSAIVEGSISYKYEDSHEKGYWETVFDPSTLAKKTVSSMAKGYAKSGSAEMIAEKELEGGQDIQRQIGERLYERQQYEQLRDSTNDPEIQAQYQGEVRRTEAEIEQLQEKFDSKYEYNTEGVMMVNRGNSKSEVQGQESSSGSTAQESIRTYEFYVEELGKITQTLGMMAW